ncbi:hypothetical protein C4D60_Mb07t14950 [Musa balbisiana]|uniref:WRKY domain-containing protein n=1 Tax=Musa balbisiana TaxID=52838 RepID=A0A4S8JHV5_MUSBA|nr:hypothetical protein C4D60_Mb07t14950 [Musa balbisiana]
MADDDWDLGAVVRSCRPSGAAAPRQPFSSFPPPTVPLEVGEEAEGVKDGSFVGFPDLFRSSDGLQELEELCKPFVPKVPQQPQQLARASPSSASPASAASAVALPRPHQPPPSRQHHRPASQIARSKRRKNQQKKVVCHVPAAGLSSDVWAWRKYGQKPIKGSPYPRGYYRCSSSKGCLARKQVERSRTDPGMFIITYTAEHNHPVPTHRNSLAGSTRHKFPSTTPAAAAEEDGSGGPPPPGNPSSSPPSSSTAAGLSPNTPLTASMEDELLRRPPQDGDDADADDGEDEEVDEDEEMLLVEDMEVMGEDDLLFMGGAEESTGPAAAATSDTAPEASAFFGDDGELGDHFFQPPWLSKSNNAATAAGGS